MMLEVTCRNVELTERTRAAMDRKASKLSTYLRDPAEIHVHLRRERHTYVAELSARGPGQRFQAHAEGDSARTAFDAASARLLRTMKRARKRNLDQVHTHVERIDGFRESA